MNKKGFTLVEVLAVVAMIAVLIVILAPSIIDNYKNANKSSFKNEISTIVEGAIEQYTQENVGQLDMVTYCYMPDDRTYRKSIDLVENFDNIGYLVQVASGEIQSIKIIDFGKSYYVDGNVDDIRNYTRGIINIDCSEYVSFQKFVVSYDTNGGAESLRSGIKDYGGTVQITNVVPTREGYNFASLLVDINKIEGIKRIRLRFFRTKLNYRQICSKTKKSK